MPTEPWKYAENQFLAATDGDITLMGEIFADHLPRLEAAAAADPAFGDISAATGDILAPWIAAENAAANAEAGQISATLGFTEKIDGLSRKPDADTNSPLETWDATIRMQVPYQGTVYTYLLPRGRETLTAGSFDERLDALRAFAQRLSQQAAKPVLVALGTTVSTFATAAQHLRDAQTTFKGQLSTARQTLEILRVDLARRMHGNVGFALFTWNETPLRIETLWDLSLLRAPAQVLPAAPGATTWTPATRSLAVAALPADATRLVAWRLAPGGAPEQLATGDPGALTVTLPGDITFTAGLTYQLWLQSRNAKGQSSPGPVTNWTAA